MQPESDGELDDLDQGDVEALPPIFFTSKKKGMTVEDVAKLLLPPTNPLTYPVTGCMFLNVALLKTYMTS